MKIFAFLFAIVLNHIGSANAGCVIDTRRLHDQDTAGTGKIERLLKAKGYEVVTDQSAAPADFELDLQYFGNSADKALNLVITRQGQDFFFQSVNYRTPFGIEGGIFERVHAVGLAKQVPACPESR